jgi:uncharacterized membrane protein YsdA (DUF1294 family)
MSEEVITCSDCGQMFIWNLNEQRYYREHNYSPPKRCPDCRQKRMWDQAKNGNIPVRSQALRDWPPKSAAPAAPPQSPAPARRVSPVTRVSTRSAQPQYASWWANAIYRIGAMTFGLALLIALMMRLSAPSLDIVFCWAFAITVTTVFTYGYDKTVAGTDSTRVPERVLLALTLAGGTIGAVIGMRYFNHKTSKVEFQSKFWLVLVVQIMIVIIWFAWLSPLLQHR